MGSRARAAWEPAAGPAPQPELSKDERKAQYEAKYNVTDPDSGIVHDRGQLFQGYNVHAAVADGQVILATRLSGVSPDQGQLAATLDHAKAMVAKLGIEERIELALADAGNWLREQIGQVQDASIRLLVPPPTEPGRHPAGDPARRHNRCERHSIQTKGNRPTNVAQRSSSPCSCKSGTTGDHAAARTRPPRGPGRRLI